jgi:hypothetical protein
MTAVTDSTELASFHAVDSDLGAATLIAANSSGQ